MSKSRRVLRDLLLILIFTLIIIFLMGSIDSGKAGSISGSLNTNQEYTFRIGNYVIAGKITQLLGDGWATLTITHDLSFSIKSKSVFLNLGQVSVIERDGD